MARLKSEVRRLTQVVGVRFHPDDLQQLQDLAAENGMTLPEFLRSSGLEKLHSSREMERAAS